MEKGRSHITRRLELSSRPLTCGAWYGVLLFIGGASVVYSPSAYVSALLPMLLKATIDTV